MVWALNDPDVYGIEAQAGRADPIPWYYEFFQIADRCNCKPWELLPEEPTAIALTYWRRAARVVIQAENEHARFVQERQSKAK